MTGTFQGADLQALRGLRMSMLAFVGDLAWCTARTTSTLDRLQWTGQDRHRFREDWEQLYRPAMRRVQDAVVFAADELEAHADEQDVVSSAPGGGLLPPPAVATAGATTGASTSTPAAAGASAPVAEPAREHTLGALSARYESNGDPGTVSTGRGDHGGVSYGMYQFSSTQGSAQEFVDGLRDTHPEYHAALDGLTPGTQEFSDVWRDLAARDPEGFAAAQHEAIERSHYEPQLRATEARLPGIDLENRSDAVRDVLWSTAVQHGGRTDDIFERAVAGRDVTTMTDAELISAVYAERGRDDGAAYFGRSSEAVRAGVMNRFRHEERDALRLLGE